MDWRALKEPGKGSDERGRKGKEWRTQHSNLGVFFFFGYYISLLGWSRSWSWKWEWGFGLFPFFSFGANYLPSYPSLGHTSTVGLGRGLMGVAVRRSYLVGCLYLFILPPMLHLYTLPIYLVHYQSFSLSFCGPFYFPLVGWELDYLSVTVPYAPNLTSYVYTWRSELALCSGILGLGVFTIGTQREIPCCSLRFVPHWRWHDRPREMPPVYQGPDAGMVTMLESPSRGKATNTAARNKPRLGTR